MSKVNALLQGTLNWVDERFPLTGQLESSHLCRILRAEELQLLVFHGLAWRCWCW
jgi:hypothetical protein